jgi:DNA-binding MarR family transcriptional regulator
VTSALPPASAAALLDPQRIDDLLLYRLSRVSALGASVVVRLCEGRYGISRRQWRLLALIHEHGQLQPSALAERAHLDRARTSRAVGELIAKGLVDRASAAGDQRFAVLSLTDQGRDLHDALFPQVAAINRQLLVGLDADGVHSLATCLDRLTKAAEDTAAASVLPKAGRYRGGPARTRSPR